MDRATLAPPASISVSPDPAPLDEPLAIRVDGLEPGERVTLRAWSRDGGGRRLEARARFIADPSGVVDLTRDAPLDGDYAGVDPMGLIWAATLAPAAAGDGPNGGGILPSAPLTLRAEVAGEVVGDAVVERRRLPEGIAREVIRDGAVIGTLFHPVDGGPHPGVILVGGSEGGLHELDAALLAGRGFAVLAQAYFGTEGVPRFLVDLPLETFRAGAEVLLGHHASAGSTVGMIGGSRGGEAALLMAATYPDVVGAAVSTVGSGLLTQGIGPGSSFLEMVGTPCASWTVEGRPLPYLHTIVTDELREQVGNGSPVDLGLVFEAALDAASAEELDGLTIPVERISGGALLVTAGQDRMWPCTRLSEFAVARAERSGVASRVRHLHFPEAGHPIAPPPYGSTTETILPGPGVRFRAGGTPAANARARAEAWQQSVRFLAGWLPG